MTGYILFICILFSKTCKKNGLAYNLITVG